LKSARYDFDFTRERKLERLAEHFAEITFAQGTEAFVPSIITLAPPLLLANPRGDTAPEHLRPPKPPNGTLIRNEDQWMDKHFEHEQRTTLPHLQCDAPRRSSPGQPMSKFEVIWEVQKQDISLSRAT
jgi:hypothetical protein